MNTYWSISITIPGEWLTRGELVDKAANTRKGCAAPERREIEVEEITSTVFGLDEDSPPS